MSRAHTTIAAASVGFGFAVACVAACLEFVDHCDGFPCDEGRICVDLASGPQCVCDDLHEEVDGSCVAIEEEAPVDAGAPDAG